MSGPLLFFTGGTALKALSAELAGLSIPADLIAAGEPPEPSVHIVTTFDSGGSSAALRDALAMPAVGDIRNRILALSPDEAPLAPLMAHRIAPAMPEALLELLAVISGVHPLVRAESAEHREPLVNLLGILREYLPPSFDCRGASVGNLVLTALYLHADRNLTRAAQAFARLTGARGEVLPVTEVPAQLAVRLADGREIVGQHRFASKCAPLGFGSPMQSVRLVCPEQGTENPRVAITPEARQAVAGAGLICYPIGSFFSSVTASLLPEGVAEAVSAAACPKVYLPNPGFDPELEGVPFAAQVATLLRLVTPQGLTHILLDEHAPEPELPADCAVHIVRAPLLDAAGNIDPRRGAAALRGIRERFTMKISGGETF